MKVHAMVAVMVDGKVSMKVASKVVLRAAQWVDG